MRADSSARLPGRRLLLLLVAILFAGAGGCERRQARETSLSFEDLSDTTGLSAGAPILASFEPVRITGGALLVRGLADLPDSARLQISVVRITTRETVGVTQVTVKNRSFETPAIFGPRGPLPIDVYRFEVLAHFNPAWQPASVLRATHDGRSLRGPGITRSRAGQPAFFLREERRL
jgi:hypothetical protein